LEAVSPAFTVVLALAVGIATQSMARHLRIPGIVLLLLAGAALGPDGLGWVEPRALGESLFTLVDLAVAVILFEGGLNLEIASLRRQQRPIRLLVTIGPLITILGGGLACRLALGWPWMASLLFGGLVAVTGPTVVTPLVRGLRLRPRVATVLEAEGVLVDPIGAILAVLLLELAVAGGAESMAGGAWALVARLSFGTLAGGIGGLALGALLRVRRLVPEGYENVLVLSGVLLLFQSCEELVSHSGLLAVALAGVTVGNLRTRVDRDLREFKEELTALLIGMLFVLLAADVRLTEVRALGWRGIAVVGALVIAIRPLCVWVSTLGSDLTRGERGLVAWIAPRGIVAAAVASITAVTLDAAGHGGGAELRALVFLTIAATVLLAGLTAAPVARLLGQQLPGRETVAILGAQGLGLALARELSRAGNPVVFLDSNPESSRRAEEAGFPVVFGNALLERTLLRARFDEVATVIGLTPNQILNSVFVSRARDQFRVERSYIAIARPDAGLAPELLQREEAGALFEGPHDVERWDVRARHGDLVVSYFQYRGRPEEKEEDAKPEEDLASGERFVILTLRRARQVLPMSWQLEPREGDVAAVAIHRPEGDAARAALRALGWEPLPGDPPAAS